MLLKESLKKYTDEVYPMHMPGHKGGRYKLLENIYEMDVTEVEETDHLYNAEGMLKRSMQKLQRFYGTKKTVYLVNGSTVGVLSAMGGVMDEGDDVLIARNCHQSVYHGLQLFDLTPHYIYPKMTQWGLVGGVDPDEVEVMLRNKPSIKAFVLTSPTYEGFLSDIERIVKICHRYGVILIVDEAHGAHLPFSPSLPNSALDYGADIVIHSMHKTLPTFTGSGLLHLNLPKALEEKVLIKLQQLQTSSPSYIMMAQMEACVKQLGRNEKVWKKLLNGIKSVENRSSHFKKLQMIKKYSNKTEGIIDKDPLKSILLTKDAEITGNELLKIMRDDHKIGMELASPAHMLGIYSVADNRKAINQYFKALAKEEKSLQLMDVKGKKMSKERSYIFGNRRSLTSKKAMDSPLAVLHKGCEMIYSPKAVEGKEFVEVPLEEAIGRVAAKMITPYPPGIPAVVAGEKITEKIVMAIKLFLDQDSEILGIDENMVTIVKE